MSGCFVKCIYSLPSCTCSIHWRTWKGKKEENSKGDPFAISTLKMSLFDVCFSHSLSFTSSVAVLLTVDGFICMNMVEIEEKKREKKSRVSALFCVIVEHNKGPKKKRNGIEKGL